MASASSTLPRVRMQGNCGILKAHPMTPSPRAALGQAPRSPEGPITWPSGLGGPRNPAEPPSNQGASVLCCSTLGQGPKPSQLGILKAQPRNPSPRAQPGLAKASTTAENTWPPGLGVLKACSVSLQTPSTPTPKASALSCLYLVPGSKSRQAGVLEGPLREVSPTSGEAHGMPKGSPACQRIWPPGLGDPGTPLNIPPPRESQGAQLLDLAPGWKGLQGWLC